MISKNQRRTNNLRCKRCKKCFSTIYTLNRHNKESKCAMREVNSLMEATKSTTCNACQKDFTTKGSLKRHSPICKVVLSNKDERILELKDQVTKLENRLEELDVESRIARECATLNFSSDDDSHENDDLFFPASLIQANLFRFTVQKYRQGVNYIATFIFELASLDLPLGIEDGQTFLKVNYKNKFKRLCSNGKWIASERGFFIHDILDELFAVVHMYQKLQNASNFDSCCNDGVKAKKGTPKRTRLFRQVRATLRDLILQ